MESWWKLVGMCSESKETTIIYRWTDWIWEITGSSTRLWEHNIIQPCGLVHGTCHLYLWALEPNRNIRLLFIHLGQTWKFWWSYTPNTMRKNYCTSPKYLYETLYILVLFVENTIHSIAIIGNTNRIHNILTIKMDTFHYSHRRQFLFFSKFLPMKIR